jgi:hypothetical protein
MEELEAEALLRLEWGRDTWFPWRMTAGLAPRNSGVISTSRPATVAWTDT